MLDELKRAGQLRRHRHQPDASRGGCQQALELPEVGIEEVTRVERPGLLAAEERPLEMSAQKIWSRAPGDRRQRCDQIVQRCRSPWSPRSRWSRGGRESAPPFQPPRRSRCCTARRRRRGRARRCSPGRASDHRVRSSRHRWTTLDRGLRSRADRRTRSGRSRPPPRRPEFRRERRSVRCGVARQASRSGLGDLRQPGRAVGVIPKPQRELVGQLLAADDREDRHERLRCVGRQRHVDTGAGADHEHARLACS